ncbi:MAG TPA: Bax inhibitor-1/YccA family protein [Candidatus Thalassarchaeaceae archaeon]|nr:Bax inhibitor-1/YccA family protein [Candidatus Thalassarchaeaceae archaeon]|tara:strand:- start:527 stop:1288 length:762 start_codon:yes stop_codon:yes gene_type:complete
MYRTKNPALNDMVFAFQGMLEDKMTIQGVTEKGVIAFLFLMTAGLIPWSLALTGNVELAIAVMSIGFLLNGIFYIILLLSWFIPSIHNLFSNPIFVLGYAGAQGFLLGGSTYFLDTFYPGIAIQAFLITGMIFGGMLLVYRTGIINVNENFRIAIYSAVFAIMMVYLLTFILGIFGIGIPYIHGSGPIGIGFSLLVIGLGALMLASDFDYIERGVENGAPKNLEWRAVFGLLVTLIWIYVEVLRLLMKLNNRR